METEVVYSEETLFVQPNLLKLITDVKRTARFSSPSLTLGLDKKPPSLTLGLDKKHIVLTLGLDKKPISSSFISLSALQVLTVLTIRARYSLP